MNIGDPVHKTSGDYRFIGIIVAKFKKLSGQERVVVENFDGILHIFSEAQLRFCPASEWPIGFSRPNQDYKTPNDEN